MKQKKYLIWFMAVALAAVFAAIAVILWPDPIAEPTVYKVVFQDHDGTVLKTEEGRGGEAATAPNDPNREGYIFVGWDKGFSAITEDTVISAEYLRLTDTVFTVETVTAEADVSRVEVKIFVTNNPGILGMALSVGYDDEQLRLVDAGTGSVLSRLSFQKPSVYADGCRFVWYGSETGEVKDGDILLLTFEIPAAVEAGEYPISLSWDSRDIYDGNCDMLKPETVDGKIKVLK